jgi:hypothetical protein
MPRCECGFDFAKSRLKGRQLQSYVLIPDKDYRSAIRREYAIVIEKDAGRKLALIAKASCSIGSLTRCPECGAWFLKEPLQGVRGDPAVLRKSASKSNQAASGKGGTTAGLHSETRQGRRA